MHRRREEDQDIFPQGLFWHTLDSIWSWGVFIPKMIHLFFAALMQQAHCCHRPFPHLLQTRLDHQNGVVLPVKDTSTLSNETFSFCVCVKPLDFPQEPRIAPRLIEWIESNLQLGAQKIVIYVYSGKCI